VLISGKQDIYERQERGRGNTYWHRTWVLFGEISRLRRVHGSRAWRNLGAFACEGGGAVQVRQVCLWWHAYAREKRGGANDWKASQGSSQRYRTVGRPKACSSQSIRHCARA
jgi:hypothetical protein